MELLEQYFDTAFAAPDGINKLRELILTLAMQGKLVPQDPSDPPASQLLKEIAAEKRRLVKEGKIRGTRSREDAKEIKPEEVPYALPQGWEWVRLGNCMLKITDGTHHSPPNTESGDRLYISAKNIKDDGVLLGNATYVTKEVHDEIYARCDPEYGNLLYIKDGATTGIVTINNLTQPFSMLSSVALLKQPPQVDNCFLLYTLRSPFFYSEMRAGMTGVAITRVTLKILNDALIPLPPLKEQQRIVAKIDQLMARCAELERLRAEREQKRRSVHAAALKQLLDAQAADSNADAWQFISRHFGDLYAVKENIAELRKAVLQLAVMGKLAPQNPNDPPASQLLKEIEAEKKRLVTEGKIKAPKPLPRIKLEEMPYALPQGWEWVRLGEIGVWKSGSTPSRNNSNYYGGDIPWVKSGEVKQGRITKTEELITDLALNECSLSLNPVGSVLVAMYGANIGEVGILDIEAATNQAVCACRTYTAFDERYLLNLIASLKPYFISQGAGAAQPNISREKIVATPFPLPPLPEQHRIVTKIDQLMALCDTLDQKIDSATSKQTELLDALMASA